MAGGVVELFAEFDLLPDLLALARDAGEEGAPLQWAVFLGRENANIDHIDEWGGSRVELMQLLAEDAWLLCERAGLLANGAPTPLGESVADRDTPVGKALGDWLEEGWLSKDNKPIIPLLQQAADLLAAGGGTSNAIPGLLAVEAESIMALCLDGFAEADALIGELPEHRRAALDGVQLNEGSAHAAVVLADFVCEQHLRVVNPDSPVELAELRASLMLAAHCEWLSYADPWSFVDHFASGPRR